jgi:hypothetical protein
MKSQAKLVSRDLIQYFTERDKSGARMRGIKENLPAIIKTILKTALANSPSLNTPCIEVHNKFPRIEEKRKHFEGLWGLGNHHCPSVCLSVRLSEKIEPHFKAQTSSGLITVLPTS